MYQVLLVDDDRSTLYILKRYKGWQAHGFSVAGEAADGYEALSLLNKQHIDLIILDIKMPGMDGMELVERLHELRMDCTVVFLSTVGDFKHARQGIRLGVFDYLLKPFDDQTFGEVLGRVRKRLENTNPEKVSQKQQEQDVLSFYVPRKVVSELTEALLSQDKENIMRAAAYAYEETCEIFGRGDPKTCALLCSILKKTSKKICRGNTFIIRFENLTFEIASGSDDSEIRNSFFNQVIKMTEIIEKYELNCRESVVHVICTAVAEHIEEPISLKGISEIVHLHSDYVGKLFHKKTGQKLSKYITAMKMEHAKYLLRNGEFKNYELSQKLSYTDTDNFCKLFKNYTGMTPQEYKHSLQQ